MGNKSRKNYTLLSGNNGLSHLQATRSDVDFICRYIINQPEHHRKKTFDEEYREFVRFYQGALQWEK